jgi:hypothetical protein
MQQPLNAQGVPVFGFAGGVAQGKNCGARTGESSWGLLHLHG